MIPVQRHYTEGRVTLCVYVGAQDFPDLADYPVEYAYDADGRMTADANRGIASVEYNAAGLPWRVRFSDGALLTAVYDASGRLLQRTVQGAPLDSPYGQSVPRSWMPRRARPFEFEGSSLKHVHTPTGYLSGGSAFHFVRDHQGSVRQVVAVDGESAALCPFMKQDP